ncbi:glycosyltransferase family 2 protein [Alloscardovia theropitheci]|uniref:Glycosyltransferase family 2 protein n=1 Tax=Alloscardovia theropitheci TaxID=2496842 RepID=A0A4R0QWZ7_9BIFI|nr:glycosyltransferase family A protein [Alloscardovia theropitheci]TCD54060.1 glycosyltransferase family 2 protein [Alloscardovia theropitheci]
MTSVSIVIPTWNESRRVLDCLRNATTQTVQAHEIIVVDNNSTDNTRSIVQNFIDSHPGTNVVLTQQTAAQGLIPTRNFGLDLATGDIVARFDADCMIKPNWVEAVTLFFDSHPHIAGITGPVCYYDMPLPPVGQFFDGLVREKQYSADGMPLLFGSNMAMRREAWEAIRPVVCDDVEDVFHEDIDCSLHLFEQGFKTQYCTAMVTGASARRMGTKHDSFKNYMKRFQTTFDAHPGHTRDGYPERTLLRLYPLLNSMYHVYGAWCSIFKIDTAERLWSSYRKRVHLN